MKHPAGALEVHTDLINFLLDRHIQRSICFFADNPVGFEPVSILKSLDGRYEIFIIMVIPGFRVGPSGTVSHPPAS